MIVVLAAVAGIWAWRSSSSGSNGGQAAAGEAADRGDARVATSVAPGIHLGSVHHVIVKTSTVRPARPRVGEETDEREPLAPKLNRGPSRGVNAPYVKPVRVAPTVRRAKSAAASAGNAPATAPSDFVVNADQDFGCTSEDATHGCSGPTRSFWDYSLVSEPSVGSNGSGAILETWNWHAAYSTNGGSSFTYVDPSTFGTDVFGHFCCDQLAYYDASRDLFIWILQYSPDGAGHNAIRIAVANGAAGLAAQS